MAKAPEDIEKYSGHYSESSFWDKLLTAGGALVYKALQLFYAAQSPSCPASVKMTIYGALGYFILPIDLIPDFIPGVGFGDDLAAIAAAMGIAAMYIDRDVKEKAQDKMRDLFGEKAEKFF